MEEEIYCDVDPMNPLCDIWTFKGAKQWYWTREEAQEAYKDYIAKQNDLRR